jgi:hypothetical protein
VSVKSTSYVLSRRYGSQTRKLIMISIADFANDDGEAWPSIDTIANRAECSRRAVQENLRTLQIAGDIAIHPNAAPRGCNLYRIIFRKTETFDSLVWGGAADALPVQMGAAQTHGGGADERRPSAPEPLGTVKEPSGERERRSLGSPEGDFPELLASINACRTEWSLAFSAAERRAFRPNLATLQSVTPTQWGIIRRYLVARHAEGSPKHTPRSREVFIKDVGDVLTYAIQWDRKHRPAPAPKKQAEEEGEEISIAEALEILRGK